MLALLTLIACQDKVTPADDTAADTGGDVPITLQFAARAGDQDFSCASTLGGLGTSAGTWTPLDLRLYAHDFTLIGEDGDEAPLALTQDGMWQQGTLALLDFEDGGGTCDNGTPETNAVVTGTAPDGAWTGLRFQVGVPFELNHQDASVADPPLNLSSMFWSWNGGYKFIRLDGETAGIPDGAVFHLGSTGCSADDEGVITDCTAPNVASITLEGFDPASSTVVLDLAGLFAAVNLDADEGGSELCMSSPADPECGALFAALGLDFGDTPGDPAAQTAFRVD